MAPDEAVIQRCPNDKSSGGARLPASPAPAGIIMEKSDGFQISHNRLVRNDDGIVLGPGSHDVITRNHVFGGGDGIRIEKGHGNLVAHNVVAHTHRDGIRLTGRSAQLTSNRAVRNNDLGIEAVPGVIDGGGNEASGNGDLRQCINIVCR